MTPQPPARTLTPFFKPSSVALIGATERAGSVGRALMENLSQFPGKLFPINPKSAQILGHQAWRSITEVGEKVDLAIIVTPAHTVPKIIAECVACHVTAAIIVSAGFKETGPEGKALEDAILAEASKNGVRIVGPNCLGILSPHAGLNASFSRDQAAPGRVAFLSQSGALCTAILDWSHAQKVGFSAFVSVGSMLDVGWGDLIRYFGEDEQTTSIVAYMESVGDAQSFMAAAQQVAMKKPIVIIKAGRTQEASRAAASHTGALTGSDEVLDAALRRAGVIRVDTIEQLFDMAEVLAKQPLPKGPRLGIVTNAGGPGALATDAIVTAGGELASLSESTLAALDAHLPSHWSHANPVDVLGDADETRYATAFKEVLADPAVDGLLAVLTPQAMTDPLKAAQALCTATEGCKKPVLASWMGDRSVAAGRALMNNAGIPTYDYPDEAAQAFYSMWERQHGLTLLGEVNRLMPRPAALRERLLPHVSLEPRLLNEVEAKQLLSLAGIPVLETRHCTTLEDAISTADDLGYPVVVKLVSDTITHKTEVGGVKLNLRDAGAVADAWKQIKHAAPPDAFKGVSVQRMISTRGGIELIVGCSRDAQFGPVLLFGSGGVFVEVFHDKALALPPLSPALAEDWVNRTKIRRALNAFRGRPAVPMPQLLDTLVKLGDLCLALPEMAELDINPLLAGQDGIIALDARIVMS